MEYRYLGKSGLQISALSLGASVTSGNHRKVVADPSTHRSKIAILTELVALKSFVASLLKSCEHHSDRFRDVYR